MLSEGQTVSLKKVWGKGYHGSGMDEEMSGSFVKAGMRAVPPMGRVLRAYDRASLAAVYQKDEAVVRVREIEEQCWADTVEEAMAEEVDKYLWKRQAEEELNDFEERLRLNALRMLYPLTTGAGVELGTKRAKMGEEEEEEAEKKKKDEAEKKKKDDKGKEEADEPEV